MQFEKEKTLCRGEFRDNTINDPGNSAKSSPMPTTVERIGVAL
jgi:hypothetical protein